MFDSFFIYFFLCFGMSAESLSSGGIDLLFLVNNNSQKNNASARDSLEHAQTHPAGLTYRKSKKRSCMQNC